jgi:hypothetical protein
MMRLFRVVTPKAPQWLVVTRVFISSIILTD